MIEGGQRQELWALGSVCNMAGANGEASGGGSPSWDGTTVLWSCGRSVLLPVVIMLLSWPSVGFDTVFMEGNEMWV